MDDLLAAAAKLQEQYKRLQQRNGLLTAALEQKAKKLQALHQSVEQRGNDLTALEMQNKFAAKLRLGAGSRVKLDVGGVHFTTSVTTLMAEPDSMLAAMFSGRHELEKDDDGRVFIDRDGELFKYVLQYLREGELDVIPLPSGVKHRLKREAAFYCLSKLAEILGSDVEAKTLPGSVLLVVELVGVRDTEQNNGGECRVITHGDPLRVADRFPKLCCYEASSAAAVWQARVLPVILDAYRNYHLISVKRESSPYSWEVHLNRIAP